MFDSDNEDDSPPAVPLEGPPEGAGGASMVSPAGAVSGTGPAAS